MGHPGSWWKGGEARENMKGMEAEPTLYRITLACVGIPPEQGP